MTTNLLSDLIRQWASTVRMKDQMHRNLPHQFRGDFQNLPWKKYQYFYGVFVPVIIHNAIYHLHMKKVSRKHRKSITIQAFLTGLFDDLIDRLHLPEHRINQLTEQPNTILPPNNIEEYLCQYLYRELYQNLPNNREKFLKSVRCMVAVQEKSRIQNSQSIPNALKTNPSREDILSITKDKGAQAVLFYRSCINESLREDELRFLSHLGALLQMTNDINDALQDYQFGETTLMTMGLTLNEIYDIFYLTLKKMMESWELLPSDKYQKKRFFSRIKILLTRSTLTLDRYGRFVDPETPFDIREIPKNKVVSGLKIPLDVWRWKRKYSALSWTIDEG